MNQTAPEGRSGLWDHPTGGTTSQYALTSAPPQDLDAEKCVLGTILMRNCALDDVARLIDRLDFFRDAHACIFDKMVSLHKRGHAIDFITLKAELARTGELDRAGGPAYISALADGVPVSTNVEYYAGIVKEMAAAREALNVVERTATVLRTNPAALRNGLPREHAEAWERVALGGGAHQVGLAANDLVDAADVVREGQQIEADGIPHLLDGVVPALGMLGFLVAYAKVGKTTFGLALAAAVAMGREFLGRQPMPGRVLVIAAEDPPEYVAYQSRHLDVEPGRMTFVRKPMLLDATGLARIVATVKRDAYAFVVISSWQAVIRGLIRDENDNAGAVRVVEDVKAAARATGVPWLIDAHSGKGEDQDDDADPSKAMRGASAAAGAADYTLSLRYANGAFGTQRRLSGKGRFVSFEPIAMDFDVKTSTYTTLGNAKDVGRETTWRLIVETGALTTTAKSEAEIARDAGMRDAAGNVTTTHRKQVRAALSGRNEVGRSEELRRGQKTTVYRLLEGA